MKKIVLALATFFFMFASTSVVFGLEMGNKRKGKYLYRKVYSKCYKRGAVDSKKPILNPDSHTQTGWTKVFETKDFSKFKCGEEWGKLSDKKLTDIYTYLYNYASDSPTPAKCK
ncbi:MAG: cytochrome c family protein [Desulfobacterales bacterium]|nr:cytochrome c family protein [Desulfobacterales bacterium]MCP4160331.1 cytochrome c family protein [Deltaproteobacteria bacterium]